MPPSGALYIRSVMQVVNRTQHGCNSHGGVQFCASHGLSETDVLSAAKLGRTTLFFYHSKDKMRTYTSKWRWQSMDWQAWWPQGVDAQQENSSDWMSSEMEPTSRGSGCCYCSLKLHASFIQATWLARTHLSVSVSPASSSDAHLLSTVKKNSQGVSFSPWVLFFLPWITKTDMHLTE